MPASQFPFSFSDETRRSGKAMSSGEEGFLEQQLEAQLREQRDSLAALEEALGSDPSNSELLEVHEELVQAIKDAEEGLLHLKRSRLLREADSVLDAFNNYAENVKEQSLDPSDDPESLEEEKFFVGSKCRFRHSDGRWYNGQIVALDDSKSATISFLTPTSENMLICKFFLQQRCRFGTNCRLSHGVDVSLSSLKKYVPTTWDQSLVGSSIWALSVSDNKFGIWREAELESWDDAHKLGQVVFRVGGSSEKLGVEAIALSIYDRGESDSSSEQSDSSEDERNGSNGLGFVESTSQLRGVQRDTVIFAMWENHTRGVASKMMANMGYRQGMGLGATGQGMLNPLNVTVLPPKQSLDLAIEAQRGTEIQKNRVKKRSRGGKRKREKKFAELSRKAKDEEGSKPDVFSLINNQLAMHHEALLGQSQSVKKQREKGSRELNKVDRRALVAYDDKVKDLKIRIERLEEMASRNRKEKAVYDAAMKKLNETRKALAEAQAAHASASNTVDGREKEKRWLKF